MALAKTEFVERVLIVFNPDGSVKGAHQEKLQTLTDEGVIFQARQLEAEPLEPSVLSVLLPDQAALTAQVAALQAEIVTKDARIAELEQKAPNNPGQVGSLSAVQIRLGLLASGITVTQVDQLIQAIPDTIQRETAYAYWEYSTSYRRTHPLVATLAGMLGLTEEQVDTMWAAAAQME